MISITAKGLPIAVKSTPTAPKESYATLSKEYVHPSLKNADNSPTEIMTYVIRVSIVWVFPTDAGLPAQLTMTAGSIQIPSVISDPQAVCVCPRAALLTMTAKIDSAPRYVSMETTVASSFTRAPTTRNNCVGLFEDDLSVVIS
jgi:hypothetical protein